MAAEPKDAANAPIVFAVATAQERRLCHSAIATAAGDEPEGSHFLQTGMGPLRPEILVEPMTRLRPSGLISIGTAGGLSQSISPGTLLVPKRILLSNGTALQTDADWQARVYRALKPLYPVDNGDLLTVDELVHRPEQKRALYSKTKANAIDMESGQLAQLADQIGIRFLALRAVMDAVDDEIPGAAAFAVNDQGDTTFCRLLTYLLKHPGDLAGMLRTARRFRAAAGSLRRACHTAREALLLSC